MKSKRPINGFENGGLSWILFEVPDNGGWGDHEHLQCVDEGVYPNAHKYVID